MAKRVIKPQEGDGRRSNGDGSFRERADGTWQYAQRVNGERVYLYAPTRAALMRKLADRRAKSGGTLRPSTKATVGEVVEAFLASRKPIEIDEELTNGKRSSSNQERAQISPATYEGWERAWRHIKPHASRLRMATFDCDKVEQVRTALLREGLGARTIQLIWQVMKLSFDYAVRRKKFFSENPWRLEKAPAHQAEETKILHDEERPRFIAAATNDRLEALWLLLLLGGLRLGEALGLTWDCVDLKDGTIEISQQLRELNGTASVARTKTKESKRTIDLGEPLIQALKRRQQAAKEEGHGSPFLFTTKTGGFISRTNLRRRNFAAVCKVAKVKNLTPHGLRHSWAVASIDAGHHPTVVAQLGGWASTKMLFEIYAKHRSKKLLKAASLAIQAQLTT